MIDLNYKSLQYDVVVVGSGGSGCSAARAAADQQQRVLIVSKDPFAASDTKIAEGIVTVQGSAESSDTPETLGLNMRVQGDDLADERLTSAFADDSAAAYRWLTGEGLISGINSDGSLNTLPLPLGGHDRRRSVEHENSSLDYAHALWNSTHRDHKIDVLEDAWAVDIIKNSDSRVAGLLIYHASRGQFYCVNCRSVVLACGGASSLYFPCTDTMRGNSGDAYGMALRAGVSLLDMEQVQFLPFGIAAPRAYEGILAGEPVSCGPLGVLRDNNGRIILSELMVRTRAECAAAIAVAVADGRGTENGGCWLDLTANVEGEAGPMFLQLMRDKAGAILANIKKAMGHKAAKFEEYWEVRPTAHYFMGGVEADENGATSLPGLFVAGQALGGLHGSNRLGSTSLAEAAIFGLRAGSAAGAYAAQAQGAKSDSEAVVRTLLDDLKLAHRDKNIAVYKAQRKLQQAAYRCIGPARSDSLLHEFSLILEEVAEQLTNCSLDGPAVWNQNLLDYLDTRNMLISARAIMQSAQARTQSLGAHVRTDRQPSRFKQNASLRVSMQQGEWLVESVRRAPSPPIKRWLFRLDETMRLLRLKLLRVMPLKMRDRVLVKMYQSFSGAAE